MLSIFHSPIFIIFFILISIYIIIYIVSKIECNWYKIRFFNIKTSKTNDKLRLIFLSDFHDKGFKNYQKQLINDIIKLSPDYIILGGDFVDFSTINAKMNKVRVDNSIKFIEKLSKTLDEKLGKSNYNLHRIFFTFGNHELRLKSFNGSQKLKNAYNRFILALENNNINILEDETVDISKDISISSLNLYKGYYNEIFSKHKIIEKIDKSILEDKFSCLNKEKYNIMSFHKPDYCEDFFDFGFDLVLSGHNHGGLIKLPVVGCLFSPDLKLFPKYNDGIYNVNGKHIVVSSGIGEHFIKLRVNNRPELCVIDIN